MHRVIFASTSQYKQKQLKQLGIIFEAINPEVIEQHDNHVALDKLALSLSYEKAYALARIHPGAIVIGSDQTAANHDGKLLTKPGNRRNAQQQLLSASKQTHHFFSAVTVIHQHQCLQAVTTTKVTYRKLTNQEVDRYLDIDQPYDCVGAFKAEALGISLFESIESTDPSALIGLPLIATAKLLRQLGIAIP